MRMGELPAYPVRVACEALADPHLEGKALLSAMAAASSVFYNYTHALECFDYKVGPNEETDEDGAFWGYQVRTLAGSCSGECMVFVPQHHLAHCRCLVLSRHARSMLLRRAAPSSGCR